MPATPSEAWAIQATFGRLVARGMDPAKIEPNHLLSLVNDALIRLTKAHAQLPSENAQRQLFEQIPTAVDLNLGIGNLGFMEAAGYLPETIDPGKIFHIDSPYPLQPLADQAMLNWPWPSFYIYYCIVGNLIYTLNLDGRQDTLAGELTVTAVQIPALLNLPPQLQAAFIDEMEILATQG